jgi:hypothetical protein
MEALTITGAGELESVYPIADFATAAIAAAALSLAELLARQDAGMPSVEVNRRLAAFWFGWSLHPIGWSRPEVWDPLAGDYRTHDGWIRLHTNIPRHRAAALRILGQHLDQSALAESVIQWSATALETAIIQAGGCAAEMRTLSQWNEHPQGRALAQERLVEITEYQPSGPHRAWRPLRSRPLAGIKVLDLTRVLAGPVASRFLAGYGAEVLRIDPPRWDEPGVIPEVTLGKRCARLNLEQAEDRQTFEHLLAQADLLLHGYRPGALEGLGYDQATRRRISPHLIDIALSAYGWSGPWASRRGFDSLVQMSTGIAHAGMLWKGVSIPTPLPVQALDQATGYLIAATAIRALTRRMVENIPTSGRLSLARTARLLSDGGEAPSAHTLLPEKITDLSPIRELTAWGEAQRFQVPVTIEGAAMYWQLPAGKLGSAAPSWLANT